MFTGLLTIGNGIVVLVFILLLAGLYYFKKMNLLKSILYQGILEADEYFESSKGQEKAKYVLDLIKPSIPSLLRMFISEKVVLKMIDSILEELKELFESKEANRKDIQKKAIDKFAEIAKNTEFNKDGSIINNSQIDIINAELNTVIDEGRGELYGAVKVATDFKGNDDLKAEVGVKYKF